MATRLSPNCSLVGVQVTTPLAFGPWFYLLVPATWTSAFLALRVYDPARALRYLGDVQAVWSAVTWATLVFAGVAYLFFREFSRLLFIYFYLLDLVFLLSKGLFASHVTQEVTPLLAVRVGVELGRRPVDGRSYIHYT